MSHENNHTYRITILFFTCFVALSSHAGWFDNEDEHLPKSRKPAPAQLLRHGLQPSLGFDRSHVVFGLSYEYRVKEYFGLGGNFYFTPEDKDSFYPQIMAFGFHVNLHQPIGKEFEVYFKPGIGIGFIEGRSITGRDDDKTVLAPGFSIGLLYHVMTNFYLGVEHVTSFIWTDEEFLDDDSSDFLLTGVFRF